MTPDHIASTIRQLRCKGDEISTAKAILLETGFLQHIGTFTKNCRKNNIPTDKQQMALAQCFAATFYSALAGSKGERLLAGALLLTDLMQSCCDQVVEELLARDGELPQ
jgi:hypothetical protein